MNLLNEMINPDRAGARPTTYLVASHRVSLSDAELTKALRRRRTVSVCSILKLRYFPK
jgi:hypothetical protein